MELLKYNEDTVSLTVSSYKNGRLYVGLLAVEEGKMYSDITINLPGAPCTNPYEAYLSEDLRDVVAFLTENGLGSDTGKKMQYGMGSYTLFHFYPGRLRELDRDGFMEFERRCGRCV